MRGGGLRVVSFVAMAIVLALASSVGCGPLDTTVDSVLADSTSTSAAATLSASVFSDLAVSASPMPVYGLAEIPLGATVPAHWWPVLDADDPAVYEGPPTGNPRVLGGQGYGIEAQLVMEFQGGWVAVLENFRGDLGDTSGVEVGVVAGHRAFLYAVNGGSLVQWSDGGRWYGVFGRGVSSQTVVDIALEMQVVPGGGVE